MSVTRRRFAPELKGELWVVISTLKNIKEVADASCVGQETLRNRLHKYREVNRPGFVGDFILGKRGWSHGQTRQAWPEVFGGRKSCSGSDGEDVAG